MAQIGFCPDLQATLEDIWRYPAYLRCKRDQFGSSGGDLTPFGTDFALNHASAFFQI